MALLERHTLTAEGVLEDAAGVMEAIDDQVLSRIVEARARRMAALLDALPEGFRVECTRGRAGPTRDPGGEFSLLDCRRTYAEPVARVARRLIGSQRISWTGGPQLRDVEQAEAFAIVVQLAITDAGGRE